jgi:hypothetical protein
MQVPMVTSPSLMLRTNILDFSTSTLINYFSSAIQQKPTTTTPPLHCIRTDHPLVGESKNTQRKASSNRTHTQLRRAKQ